MGPLLLQVQPKPRTFSDAELDAVVQRRQEELGMEGGCAEEARWVWWRQHVLAHRGGAAAPPAWPAPGWEQEWQRRGEQGDWLVWSWRPEVGGRAGGRAGKRAVAHIAA